MRTYLLIIALAALAAAQATQPGIATQIINLPDTIKTTIDEISYSLVKQRTELPQITVPLPAAAYKDYGNIKLIVIAIPYSPEEDPDQAIKEAIKELTEDEDLDFGTKVRNAIDRLLSIRSVFYPYETFKVRLIFIMFVHTQTLIDYAIEASANLLNSGNKQSGAALYTNSIMEILYAKYQTWKSSNKPKLGNKINSFKLQTSQSGDIITFMGQVDGKTVLEFSVTVTASKYTVEIKVNDQTQTITICRLSSSVGEIDERFTGKLADEIRTTLPKLDLEDLQRVFAGKNDINNIANDFNIEIDNYYYNYIIKPKTKYYQNFIKEYIKIIDLFYKNYETTCSDDNCDCENVKKQMIDSILQQSSSLESWLKNSYKLMLEDIDGAINNCLGVVNDIKSSLLPNCDNDNSCKMIRNTLEGFGNTVAEKIGSVAGRCVGKYLGEIAEKGINSVVSTIPVVNLGYILANGIMGALQKQVTIEGTIVSESVLAGGLGGFKVYYVSNRIACYSREIRDISGQNFVSKPSMKEAIFAAIMGFTSAVGQLFLGDLAKTVDLIPIVRTVDMPTDGYFMFTATPGVYVLKINNLKARNIIDKFKEDMINKIRENLANSYNKGSKCELYKKINEKVENVLSTTNLGNRNELYQKAGVGNYISKENDRNTLTLEMYFVVIPPYMAGTRFGSGYSYTLVADLFGLLRSFLSPTIGDVRRHIVSSTNICPDSTVHTSPGVVGGAIESACVNIVRSAGGVVNNAMSRVINNLFNFEFHPKDQITCSLEDVLKYSVEAAIYTARNAIVTKISEAISDRLINELFKSIEQSVCSWLGDQVGNQIEQVLSSLLERLFDLYGTGGFSQSRKMSYSFRASYGSGSNKLTEAFCRLVGSPQIINYLGLYAVRIFDAAEEGLYVPSYFLSAYPIQFKESPTARWCYSVVMSPYYIYKQPPLPTREKEVKSLLIDALDVIRDNENLKTGLLNFLRDKYVQTKILWIIPWQDKAVKENNKVACNPRAWPIPWYNPYLDFNICWDRGNLRWTIDSLQLGHLSQSDMQFLRGLLMQRSRLIEVPVLAGVNKYFDAFKVYPAIAVREVGNPNPYYFVVPYSTPARELFVLGTVGDVVVYDGGLRGSGGGKPFLYYDVSR